MKVQPNNSMEAMLYKRFSKNPKRLVDTYWIISLSLSKAWKDHQYPHAGYRLCRVAHVTRKYAICNDTNWDTHKMPIEALLLGTTCIYLGTDFQHTTYVEDSRSGWQYAINQINAQHLQLELIRGGTDPAPDPALNADQWIEFPTFSVVTMDDYLKYFKSSSLSSPEGIHQQLRSATREALGQDTLRRLYAGTYTPPEDTPPTEEAVPAVRQVDQLQEPEPLRVSSWERLTADE